MSGSYAIVVNGVSTPIFGACIAFCKATKTAHVAFVTQEEHDSSGNLLAGAGRMPAGYVSMADLVHGLHRMPASYYDALRDPNCALRPIIASLLSGPFADPPQAAVRPDAGLFVALWSRLKDMPFFTMEWDRSTKNVHVHQLTLTPSDNLLPTIHEIIVANVGEAGDAATKATAH